MKKNIEDLFSETLTDFEQDLSPIDDLNFEKIIAKKPSFWNKNIGYILATATVVGVMLYIGFKPNNETVERKNNLIEDTNSNSVSATQSIIDKDVLEQKNIENEQIKDNSKIQSQKEKHRFTTNTQNAAPTQNVVETGLKPGQEPITNNAIEQMSVKEPVVENIEPEMEAIKIKPLRKRHTIVKRDTIFNQDTLRKILKNR